MPIQFTEDAVMAKELTSHALRTRAEWYLLRYPASSANLARFLRRAVGRIDPEATPGEAEPLIRAVMEDLRADGVLNDAAFARARARRLLARGQPPQRIAARLGAQQLPEDAVAAALAALEEESGDPETQERLAACRIMRRRGLGPCRPQAEREEHQARDLAILARAGVSYATARAVLALPDGEAVEAVLNRRAV